MPAVNSRQAQKLRKAKALEKQRANAPPSPPSVFDKPRTKKRKLAQAAAAARPSPGSDEDEATGEHESAGSAAEDDWEERPKKASKKSKKAAARELAPILPELPAILTPADIAAALRAEQRSESPEPAPAKPVKSAKRPPGAAKKNKKTAAPESAAALALTVPAPTPASVAAPAVVAVSPTLTPSPPPARSPSPPVAAAVSPAGTVASTSTSSAAAKYLAKHAITLSESYAPVTTFDALPISPKLAAAFKTFKAPTPIQACAWPALLEGKDVVGIAETGSGKTLGFGIPALEHLLHLPTPPYSSKACAPPIVIVSPTRELAMQTSDTLVALTKPLKARCVCLYGGASKDDQSALLKGGDVRIIVATPGRLIDMINDKAVSLDKVSYLVLDEADRMLDTGFEAEVKQIFARVPKTGRQTVMFSATWPDSVRALAGTYMRSPVRITVGSDKLTANVCVEQKVEVLDSDAAKEPRLLAVLQAHKTAYARSGPSSPLRVVVFALYKKEAVRLELLLRKAGYKVAGLHGDMLQAERVASLEAFKKAKVNILVATDVAARGLDVPDVSLVVNVTFPLNVEDYVHRIGRAGRGGKKGKAITFFTGIKHEKTLAGPFQKVLLEAGADIPKEMSRFPKNIVSQRESKRRFFAEKDARRAAGEDVD